MKKDGIDNIDNSIILPSFIDENYLKQKFNKEKNNEQEEIDNDMLNNKIIIDNKKLSIFVDKTKNIEHKIYESDDFCQVIKQLTKIKTKKDDFDFKLIKILKNGIFIIESENIITYGAFFFIKFNDSKKGIEIIAEHKNRKIQFIAEFYNGNFAYNCYIHRPLCTQDSYYIYDITKNEEHLLHTFGEYYNNNYCLLKYAFFTNGFAFTNNLCVDKNWKHEYLNVVEGFDIHIYTIDFIGYIDELIYDDKYLYLIKKDNKVYIFNIEKKNFILILLKFHMK